MILSAIECKRKNLFLSKYRFESNQNIEKSIFKIEIRCNFLHYIGKTILSQLCTIKNVQTHALIHPIKTSFAVSIQTVSSIIMIKSRFREENSLVLSTIENTANK